MGNYSTDYWSVKGSTEKKLYEKEGTTDCRQTSQIGNRMRGKRRPERPRANSQTQKPTCGASKILLRLRLGHLSRLVG